jgi:hypothetical protein
MDQMASMTNDQAPSIKSQTNSNEQTSNVRNAAARFDHFLIRVLNLLGSGHRRAAVVGL